MLLAALVIACLTLVGLLALRERAAAVQARALAAQLGREIEVERSYSREVLDRAEKERRELYQRIQAPEIAVAEAHRERRGPYTRRKPIGADDDKAFAEKRADG